MQMQKTIEFLKAIKIRVEDNWLGLTTSQVKYNRKIDKVIADFQSQQAKIEEIEKLLIDIRYLLSKEIVCGYKVGICRHDNKNCPIYCIDQALNLLRQFKGEDEQEISKCKK